MRCFAGSSVDTGLESAGAYMQSEIQPGDPFAVDLFQ